MASFALLPVFGNVDCMANDPLKPDAEIDVYWCDNCSMYHVFINGKGSAPIKSAMDLVIEKIIQMEIIGNPQGRVQ